ncbi:hypothetical protein RB196_31665 [Streptomyces sp. PmtA]
MNSTNAAATRETIGLRPPAPSAAALRDALPETTKPRKKPTARLTAPTATISRSAFTSSPWRRAKRPAML